MTHWISSGELPPKSRYPKIADQTLVPLNKVKFPKIAQVSLPEKIYQAKDYDFGRLFDQKIIDIKQVKSLANYPVLVPQVDHNGNELGGISMPEHQVPLATYTGWNIYKNAHETLPESAGLTGSYIPFLNISNKNDERQSISALYKSKADYQRQYLQAAKKLIKENYLLSSDLPFVMQIAEQRWHFHQPRKVSANTN